VQVGESGVSVIQNSAAAAAAAADDDDDTSISEHSSDDSAVHFSVQLSPGIWHQVALGVNLGHVTLHVDCDDVATSPWRRRRRAVANGNADDDDDDGGTAGSSLVLSVGKAFIESSRYPRFQVRRPSLAVRVQD